MTDMEVKRFTNVYQREKVRAQLQNNPEYSLETVLTSFRTEAGIESKLQSTEQESQNLNLHGMSERRREAVLSKYRQRLEAELGKEATDSMLNEDLTDFNEYLRLKKDVGKDISDYKKAFDEFIGGNPPIEAAKETMRENLEENTKEDSDKALERLEEMRKVLDDLDICQTEISKAEYEEAWRNNIGSKRTFKTNGSLEMVRGKEVLRDETITYETAVGRIKNLASDLMTEMENEKKIHFSRNDKKEVLERMEDALIKQQAYTDRRGIGEHGIKHIFGNIERSDYALGQQKVSSEARFAALVAQIYHDEGYTTDEIHSKAESDKEHDRASLKLFIENQQPFYEKFFVRKDGVLDAGRMEAIYNAIGMHNRSNPAEIKKYTNPQIGKMTGEELENHLIMTAVHVSDKCALSENEKLVELYESKESMELLTRVYEAGDKVMDYKSSMKKELENISPDDAATRETYEHAIQSIEETEKHLKNKMKTIVEESNQSEDMKNGFYEAIDKDISLASAKFTAPMNDIALSNQAFELVNDEDGVKAKITLHAFDYDNAEKIMGAKLAQKQVAKVFSDMGVSKQDSIAVAQKALTGEPQELDGQNMIIQVKKISVEQIENNEKHKDIRSEVKEGVEQTKRLFSEKLSQEKLEICRSIEAKLKENPDSITSHDINKLIKLNSVGSLEKRQKNIQRWKNLKQKCEQEPKGMKTVASVLIAQTYANMADMLIDEERGTVI